MSFKSSVLAGLADVLDDQGTKVVVDSVESVPGTGSNVLSVRFHLEGDWASPSGFVFPFAESVPLDESLTALRNSVSRSWKKAHLAPGDTGSQAAAGSAGD